MIQKTYKAPRELTVAELRRDVRRGVSGMKWGWIILIFGIASFLVTTFAAPAAWLQGAHGISIFVICAGFALMFSGQSKAIRSVKEITRRENREKGIREEDE